MFNSALGVPLSTSVAPFLFCANRKGKAETENSCQLMIGYLLTFYTPYYHHLFGYSKLSLTSFHE